MKKLILSLIFCLGFVMASFSKDPKCFNSVKVSVPSRIIVYPGSYPNYRMVGDSMSLKNISCEVVNKTLIVKSTSDLKLDPVTIYIVAPATGIKIETGSRSYSVKKTKCGNHNKK